MLPNHSCSGAIVEEHFLEGTPSLEKINSNFLQKEFRRDSRRFLEDLVSTILSTVAARSSVGQGLSCFCPEIVIGGDDYSALHLFGQLLDGLIELGWVRGSEIEPAKAEFHSFVHEQRQVETSGNRSRVPISSVFAFCNQPQIKGAVACVQDFVRNPHFTQMNFFSETGISMLNTAVTAADAVRNSARFDHWGVFGVEASPVIADLKSCREKFVSWRKAVRDTRERWFSAETVASSAVDETVPRTTVRISDVVEVGDMQYVEEHEKLGLPCCSRSSRGKSKKRRAPVSPGATKKNIFLLQVRLLAVLHLNLLFRIVLRSRGREKVVVIAVVPQFSKEDTNNNLIVFMYRLLAFEI